MKRRATKVAKIKGGLLTTWIHKNMSVFFKTQMLECACFFHQRKQVVIAAKKYVQAHLNMVTIFV